MKKQNCFLLILCLISLFIYGCDSEASKTSSLDSLAVDTNKIADNASASHDSTKNAADTMATETWHYSEEEDKMTSTKKYFANIDANEELIFPFPYDGGSTATIYIRNKEKENNVMLCVSKGQFLCNASDGCMIRARFDDNKPETFECSEPADYDTKTIFINSAIRFIKKCKTSKKVILEATFYQAGSKQMEFNIEGLKWDH